MFKCGCGETQKGTHLWWTLVKCGYGESNTPLVNPGEVWIRREEHAFGELWWSVDARNKDTLVNPVMCGCVEKDTPAGTRPCWTPRSWSVDVLSSQCDVLWSSPTTSYRLKRLVVLSFQQAGRWIFVYCWFASFFVKTHGCGKDHAAIAPVITRKQLRYTGRETKMADEQSTKRVQSMHTLGPPLVQPNHWRSI